MLIQGLLSPGLPTHAPSRSICHHLSQRFLQCYFSSQVTELKSPKVVTTTWGSAGTSD